MPSDPPSRKYYLCTGELVNEEKIHQFEKAHIVGELCLRRDRETEKTVGVLAVYRESLPTDKVPLIRPPVSNYTFHSPNVFCSRCERAPRWEINHSAFMALMAHYGLSTLEEG